MRNSNWIPQSFRIIHDQTTAGGLYDDGVRQPPITLHNYVVEEEDIVSSEGLAGLTPGHTQYRWVPVRCFSDEEEAIQFLLAKRVGYKPNVIDRQDLEE